MASAVKICLVVRALPVHRLGGLEYHALDLANAQAVRGHAVTVVTSRHPAGLREETLPSGVRVRYLEQGRSGDYSPAFFRGVEREVSRLDAQERFDVIHVQEFAGLGMARRPGRMVCTMHGTMFSETPLNRRYFRHLSPGDKLRMIWRFKPRIALHPFFVRMLRRMDLLLVDSEYSRRELLLIDPRLRPRVRLIPLGVDLSRYPQEADRGGAAESGPDVPLRIALLGRVQRMKGLGVAFQAAALLKARGVPFRMTVGGSGDYLETMSAEIASRGLDKVMELRGRVPETDIPAFFADADLFLFPDLTQPAFGLVAVEAMLYGLPVVAARSGAIPEVVGEEVGWLYEPWSAVELAAILERLAARRGELENKAAKARRHARQFTAERMAAGVEAACRALIDASAQAAEGF